jgi:hypothetical protein
VKQGSADTPTDISEGISLASGIVNLTATITDRDGDTAAASLDLGKQLTIDDDGPSIQVRVLGEEQHLPFLTVDESFLTAGTNGIAGSTPDVTQTHISGDFSTAFSSVQGADSATIGYALSIIGGDGALSGLVDAQTGSNDVLKLVGNTIEGHVGTTSGALAFTITLDPATGIVTFTEDRSVKQGTASNPDGSEGISLTAGVVTLTATITDKDGDFQTAHIDLGKQLTIDDDGPSITASGSQPTLTVDESFLTAGTNGIDGSTPDVTQTHISGDFSTAFSSVQGADSATIGYALSIIGGDGALSGLVDAQTGSNDVLKLVGNTIEGHVGTTSGALAFTITLDPATGIVTFTEDRSVKQGTASNPDGSEGISLTAGVVTLTATITDKDGDFQTAHIDLGKQLTIDDDGPSITASGSQPTLTVDESFLTAGTNGIAGSTPDLASTHTTGNFSGAFSHVNGADGATITYALSITGGNGASSGLIDSQTGLTDVLVLNGNTIEGHVGTTSGALAFTIAVDPNTGIVTLTDDRSVHQAVATLGDTSEGISLNGVANLVKLTATITDADGDTATASIDLGKQVSFLDDGPAISSIQNAIMPTINNTDAHGTWQLNFGADGLDFAPAGDVNGPNDPAFAAIGIAMGTAPAGLTYTVTDTLLHDSAGEEVFSVAVTGGTQAYTFYEYTHYDASTHTAEMFAYSDQADAVAGSTGTTNQFFTLSMAANGIYDFHLTSSASLESTVTTSFTGGGNSGEGSYAVVTGTSATFVKNSPVPAGPPAGSDLIIDGWVATDPTAPDPNNHTVHANNNGFGLDNGNFNTNSVLDFVFAHAQTAVDLGIGKSNNGTNEHFVIQLFNGSTLIATEDIILPDGQAVLVDSAHWGVGEAAGHPTTGTFGAFTSMTVENVAGTDGSVGDDAKVNLTSVSFDQQTTISSTTLTFAPTITDADGDTAHSATNLSVSLVGTANGAGGYNLTGATTAEVLVASSHADSLAGGIGGGDTVDYSGSNAGVTVNLATSTASGGWAAGDSISGFENVIGSAFNDTLTAVSTGSVLDGGANSTGGTDTLAGGAANDVLIASRAGVDSLTGGAGSDTFVLQGSGAADVTITDFLSGTDSIVVDVADKNLTISTAALINAATQFAASAGAPTTGGTGWTESTSADKFYFDNTNHDLWFSASGTGADQVKLAHLSTGVAATDVHVA